MKQILGIFMLMKLWSMEVIHESLNQDLSETFPTDDQFETNQDNQYDLIERIKRSHNRQKFVKMNHNEFEGKNNLKQGEKQRLNESFRNHNHNSKNTRELLVTEDPNSKIIPPVLKDVVNTTIPVVANKIEIGNDFNPPGVQSVSNTVMSDYENLIFQVNLQKSRKFDNSLTNSDLFVKDGKVFGYEWRNGFFLRLPFPTFSEISPEYVNRTISPNHLVSLYNRFKERRPMSQQLDCTLDVQLVSQIHFKNRFNKIKIILTSPCVAELKEFEFLHKAGLRKLLKLEVMGRKFTFQFRTISQLEYQKGMWLEQYNEYRMLNPIHHHVNFFRRKYLNDFSRIDRNERISPEMRLKNNKAILEDMETFYKSSSNAIQSYDANQDIQTSKKAILANTVIDPNTLTDPRYPQILEERRRRENDQRYNNYGLNQYEINAIYNIFSYIRSAFTEANDICIKICTKEEYYYSWDFCQKTCGIENYYLSNDESFDPPTQFFPNVSWSNIGGKREILSSGDWKKPYWTLEEINAIWNVQGVFTCRQTWTTFTCTF